jgi:hypothetical protein
MDAPPGFAEQGQMVAKFTADAPQFLLGKTIVLAQLRRSVRAVEIEHRFAPVPQNMDMRRPVVIRVDHHPQPEDGQYSGHGNS